MADGNSLPLPFERELVVDLFAGGGGASLGLARAYRHPDVAVNHNATAIAVHEANHPQTSHYLADVFEVDPLVATGGRPVAVLWASPDCRHHSKAKGGKPRSAKIRGLAWVVTKWAAKVRPRVICLENVEEFADWGPLLPDGQPCPARKGFTFRRWKNQLENMGYVVDHRELVAADYGAPTIRKRLYLVARCDGRPIAWPKTTHHKAGAGGLPKWRAAAECIDFELPAKSIFGRKKPLAENTQRRIAKGMWRYVLNCAEPFIVGVGGRMGQSPERAVSQPFQTITAKADSCLAQPVLSPFLTEHANGSSQRVFDVQEPLRTQVAQIKGGHFAMVAPVMVQTGYGEREGQQPRALDLSKPLGTVVAGGVKHALTAIHLTHLTHQGERSGNSADEPMRTVTGANRGEQAVVAAHLTAFGQNAVGFDPGEPLQTALAGATRYALVQAYLVKYYSEGGQWQGLGEPMHTVPTKDRMGVVQVHQIHVADIDPVILERAREVAAFLHRHLPEHFPVPADLVLIGDRLLHDITLRMLIPRELARAQGFPDTYVIERGANGKAITKTDQVRLIGNSVCPDMAEAIVRSNVGDLIRLYELEAA